MHIRNVRLVVEKVGIPDVIVQVSDKDKKENIEIVLEGIKVNFYDKVKEKQVVVEVEDNQDFIDPKLHINVELNVQVDEKVLIDVHFSKDTIYFDVNY